MTYTCCEQCIVKTKREFHWTRLLLRLRDSRTVAYTPWLPYNAWQVIYIAWRWILACYFVACLVVAGVDWSSPIFFIYLTDWGMLTWVAYLIVSALSCTVKFTFHMYALIKGSDSASTHVELMEKKDVESGTATAADSSQEDIYGDWRVDNVAWYQKIHWVLYNVSIPLEIGIAILYWALLYDPEAYVGSLEIADNFNLHLTPAIVALVDVWISGIILNIYHFYMILLYIAVYGVFSLIYFAAGGTDQFGDPFIYPILDYGGKPELAAGVLVGMLVFFPLCYFILYLISLPRRWLSSKLHQSCYKGR